MKEHACRNSPRFPFVIFQSSHFFSTFQVIYSSSFVVFVLLQISELVFVAFQLLLMGKRRPWIKPQEEDAPLIT